MSTPATSQACRTVKPLGILTGNPSTETSMASSGDGKWTRAPPTGAGGGSGAAAAADSGVWRSGVEEMDLKELGFRDEKTLDEVDERDLEARIARRPKPISTRSLARSLALRNASEVGVCGLQRRRNGRSAEDIFILFTCVSHVYEMQSIHHHDHLDFHPMDRMSCDISQNYQQLWAN